MEDSNRFKNTIFASPIPQIFSLPENVLFYLIKIVSNPGVYRNLIKTCKYFFPKNPILVGRRILCENLNLWISNESTPAAPEEPVEAVQLNRWSPKIWVTEELTLGRAGSHRIVPLLIPKLYTYQFTQINIDCQMLSFGEYKILTSSVECLRFHNVSVNYEDDGAVVPLETLLQQIAKIQEFH